MEMSGNKFWTYRHIKCETPRCVLDIQMEVSSQELDMGVQNSGQRFGLRYKPEVVSIFKTKRLDEITPGLRADR